MKPVWTLDQIVDNLARWNAAWPTSRPVDYAFYAFAPSHHAPVTGFSAFTSAQRVATARVFDLVSDVCNLDFRQVPSNNQEPGPGNERIGFLNVNSNNYQFTGRARIDFTDPPGDTMGVIRGADVEMNLHRASPRGGWEIGDWNFTTLMHEALHTLGLQHPGEYNGDSGHQAGYDEAAEYLQDSGQYTVMSYWSAGETGGRWFGGGKLHHAATPMLHDIAALQALYGANMSTRAGNTTYGFNSNAGRASYDLGRDPYLVFAIWDGGGRDRLDLSGYSTASQIDLNEGAFSNAGGMTQRFAIAHGAVIEDAIGGRGDDRLIGNAAGNRLDGRGGADTMAGGSGNDIYHVDHAGDRVIEGGGRGLDTVWTTVAFRLGYGLENIVMSGSAPAAGTGNNFGNSIVGNNGGNWLAGVNGDDRLEGRAGDDVLLGGSGIDRMFGGAGADTFVLGKPPSPWNVDSIFDFAPADDTIRLDRDIFTGIGRDGSLGAQSFVHGTQSLHADDRILYDQGTGRIFYDADGLGGAAPMLILWVTRGTELTAADFQAFT